MLAESLMSRPSDGVSSTYARAVVGVSRKSSRKATLRFMAGIPSWSIGGAVAQPKKNDAGQVGDTPEFRSYPFIPNSGRNRASRTKNRVNADSWATWYHERHDYRTRHGAMLGHPFLP